MQTLRLLAPKAGRLCQSWYANPKVFSPSALHRISRDVGVQIHHLHTLANRSASTTPTLPPARRRFPVEPSIRRIRVMDPKCRYSDQPSADKQGEEAGWNEVKRKIKLGAALLNLAAIVAFWFYPKDSSSKEGLPGLRDMTRLVTEEKEERSWPQMKHLRPKCRAEYFDWHSETDPTLGEYPVDTNVMRKAQKFADKHANCAGGRCWVTDERARRMAMRGPPSASAGRTVVYCPD